MEFRDFIDCNSNLLTHQALSSLYIYFWHDYFRLFKILLIQFSKTIIPEVRNIKIQWITDFLYLIDEDNRESYEEPWTSYFYCSCITSYRTNAANVFIGMKVTE